MAAWPEKIQHYKRKQQQKHRAVTHHKHIAVRVISSMLDYSSVFTKTLFNGIMLLSVI